VFSGVVWRRFAAKTGYNQGVSYHLVTPHAIKFVSKSVSKNPVSADLGAIFERAFGSYASGGRLHIMDDCSFQHNSLITPSNHPEKSSSFLETLFVPLSFEGGEQQNCHSLPAIS
jgi:hypothetical protein